ncbi:MAG: hypothetical protein U1E78_06780 [Gammaproteobacteria bacterium]
MAYFPRIGSALAASFIFVPFTVSATIITEQTVTGTGSSGSYSAQFKWDGSVLSLDLTNTSNPANGGYLTGFLLELPGTSSFTKWQTNTNLTALTPKEENYSGAPYGSFDYGYALGGNFLGGGSPKSGISVGKTGHFEFSQWNNVNGFDVGDFFQNLSTLEQTDTNLLVRFKGFNDGGSDKVVGIFNPPPPANPEPPPGNPPPELSPPPPGLPPITPSLEVDIPSSLWLMSPLLGLILFLRWRRRLDSIHGIQNP